MKQPQPFRKVDFAEYNGKYDETVGQKLALAPEAISLETLRAYLYGYTFTEGYAKDVFPDEMSMDHWKECDDAIPDLLDIELPPTEAGSDGAKESQTIDEILSMQADDDYLVDTLQERCILQAIDSTGDGKTPATALCVTNVAQEYEYIKRVFPYNMASVARQSVDLDGIDCLEFAENPFGVERIYFDIHRRFEVGYPRDL